MSGSSQDESLRGLNQSMVDASFSPLTKKDSERERKVKQEQKERSRVIEPEKASNESTTDETKSDSSSSIDSRKKSKKRESRKTSSRDSFMSRNAKHAHFLNASCWRASGSSNGSPSRNKKNHASSRYHSFDAILFQSLLFPSPDPTAVGEGSIDPANTRKNNRGPSQTFLSRRPSMISGYLTDLKYTFYHNDCRLIQGHSWSELEGRLSSLALAKSVLSDGSSDETSICSAVSESNCPELWILRLMRKGIFWLDIQDPSGSDLRALGSIFNLHPLTLEDILEGSGREKCKIFHERSYVYFCLNSPVASSTMQDSSLLAEKSSHCIAHSLNVLYFILFQDGALTFYPSSSSHPSLPLVLERVGRSQRGLVSSEWMLYATLDVMADFLFPLVKALEKEADQIDLFVNQDYQNAFSASSTSLFPDSDSLQPSGSPLTATSTTPSIPIQQTRRAGWDSFSSSSSEVINRITKARMNLTSLTRALGPRISSLRVFLKRQGWLNSATRFYFQDLEETLDSLNNSLEYVSENLSRTYGNHLVHLNIHLSVASFATNTTVKRLTVAAGIFLPLTLIANIFGMSVAVPGEQGTDWSQYTEWFVIVGILILLTVFFIWMCKRLKLI